jgi:hypothetical protein
LGNLAKTILEILDGFFQVLATQGVIGDFLGSSLIAGQAILGQK